MRTLSRCHRLDSPPRLWRPRVSNTSKVCTRITEEVFDDQRVGRPDCFTIPSANVHRWPWPDGTLAWNVVVEPTPTVGLAGRVRYRE